MYKAGLWFLRKISADLRKGSCCTRGEQGFCCIPQEVEEKYGLAFTLLSDTERKVIEAYDVWKEKKNYGKVSMGVVRTTYLIDENGIIIKANDKVKAADDPEKMLQELS